MTRILWLITLSLSLLCLNSDGSAQSLKIRESRKKQEENLAKEVTSLNKSCEASIEAAINWENTKDDDHGAKSFYSYCAGALSGMRRVCQTPEGKSALKDKIKKLECRYADKREIALKDGTLTFTIDWNAGNDADYVKEYLMNNL